MKQQHFSQVLAFILVARLCVCNGATYTVTLERSSLQTMPLANTMSDPYSSAFSFNYNPSYAALYDTNSGAPVQDALIVRVQDRMIPPYEYEVGASKIAWAPAGNRLFDDVQNVTLARIARENVILDNSDGSPLENYGVEDPRCAYRASRKVYYLFYTAVEANYTTGTVTARLALATSATPNVPGSWTKRGLVLVSGAQPAPQWSKSGAVIWRDDEVDDQGQAKLPVLLWGDTSIFYAVASNADAYTFVTQKTLISPRKQYFDSVLVESGPPPLRLSDGNYVFFYNSARQSARSIKPGWTLEYNAGYLILDGKNPANILQRSDDPILSPELPWELGTYAYPHLTPNVVFIEGAKALGGDRFLVFYGCADSTIATAVVTVDVKQRYKVTIGE